MQKLRYQSTDEERLRHIAYLQELDDDAADRPGWTIHGVAVAPEDINRGAVNGEPTAFTFTDAVLDEAAATLEGKPIIDIHSDEGDSDGRIQYPPPADITVGKVTKAAFEPGVGVLYEGTLADEDLAQKIAAGVLDVSPELGLSFADMSEEPYEVSEAMFAGLAIVSVGGAPSNTAEMGPNEALASLSVAGIDAILAQTETTSAESDTDGTGTETRGAESPVDDPDSTTMGDNPNDPPGVDTLLERIDEKDEQISTLTSEKDELEETNATLSERNETLEDEIQEVKEGYAAVLAEEGPFDEEDLIENFDVATLRERFEDRFEDGFAATLSEPDVQSGAGGDGGSDDLTTDDATLEEARDLLGRADMLESADADYAATLREEAVETVGADDVDEVLEVLE